MGGTPLAVAVVREVVKEVEKEVVSSGSGGCGKCQQQVQVASESSKCKQQFSVSKVKQSVLLLLQLFWHQMCTALNTYSKLAFSRQHIL